MFCKSLWIKASAKCINVNVNVNVKNDRLDATLIIIIFLAEYTGVIFTLTSGNVTWFYDRNFDFILKILRR